jgi:hypothetical protein
MFDLHLLFIFFFDPRLDFNAQQNYWHIVVMVQSSADSFKHKIFDNYGNSAANLTDHKQGFERVTLCGMTFERVAARMSFQFKDCMEQP